MQHLTVKHHRLMTKVLSKAHLGAIGENMVAVRLLQNGLDAILANQSINNCQSYDLICVDPQTGKTQLVQVKTSVEKNIPIGMKLHECTLEYLEKKIIGPWVFVHVIGEGENMTFQFYLLTRREIIKLIYESNDWYVNKWHRNGREIDLKSPCAIKTSWLEGNGEVENNKHEGFKNPIKSCLVDSNTVLWNKIMED